MNQEQVELLDALIERLESVYEEVKDGDTDFAVTTLIAYGEETEDGLMGAKTMVASIGNGFISSRIEADMICAELSIPSKLAIMNSITEGMD